MTKGEESLSGLFPGHLSHESHQEEESQGEDYHPGLIVLRGEASKQEALSPE